MATQSKEVGPLALLPDLADWAANSAANFSILGAERPLSVDNSWIQIKVAIRGDEADAAGGLAEAVDHYHQWATRDRGNRDVFDAETIGRFIRHAIVVAGPGMGKSVL